MQSKKNVIKLNWNELKLNETKLDEINEAKLEGIHETMWNLTLYETKRN
jgi:hypothetical protein